MSMCRVFSCVVGRGCFLLPVCSLGKALLASALLHLILQICLLSQVSLEFLTFALQSLIRKRSSSFLFFFLVFILEVLMGLHRHVQLQILQCYWSEHRLGLLWYWMVCLGNEQISFCHFWDCIQVLHFLPQGIFLIQRSNLCVLHCRWSLYCWATEETSLFVVTYYKVQ